jgi:hypothetical protein
MEPDEAPAAAGLRHLCIAKRHFASEYEPEMWQSRSLIIQAKCGTFRHRQPLYLAFLLKRKVKP